MYLLSQGNSLGCNSLECFSNKKSLNAYLAEISVKESEFFKEVHYQDVFKGVNERYLSSGGNWIFLRKTSPKAIKKEDVDWLSECNQINKELSSEKYACFKEACNARGLDDNLVRYHMKRLGIPIKFPTKGEAEWLMLCKTALSLLEGGNVSSIPAAAKELNISPKTLSKKATSFGIVLDIKGHGTSNSSLKEEVFDGELWSIILGKVA